MNPLHTAPDAIEKLRAGAMVIVCDAEGRAGHLLLAAQFATPAAIEFMTRHGRGALQTVLGLQHHEAVGQPAPAARRDGAPTAATASAADQARAVQALLGPAPHARDLERRGLAAPVTVGVHGVLERAGAAEAAIDLVRLAGLIPAALVCEIVNEDGTPTGADDLEHHRAALGLSMIAIADLIAHRRSQERLVERVVETAMPTRRGSFRAVGYRQLAGDLHHVALVRGDVADQEDVLVRVHSACLTGDAFGSRRCDCGHLLEEATRRIDDAAQGIVLYLTPEGHEIGLLDKLRAYELEAAGCDPVEAGRRLGLPAAARDHRVAAQILSDLGVRSVRLLTDDPGPAIDLQDCGVRVTGAPTLRTAPGAHPAASPVPAAGTRRRAAACC